MPNGFRQSIEDYLIQRLQGFKQSFDNSNHYEKGYLDCLHDLCRVYCPHLKRRFNID